LKKKQVFFEVIKTVAVILIRTLIVFVTLYGAMRFMGKRQLGQLELSELVVAILIADLASHPLQDIGIPLINGLVPILVLLCGEVLISGVALKSKPLRELLWGKPSVLVENGKIVMRELRRNRMSMDELAEALRKNGIYDLSNVRYAILETDGTLNAVPFDRRTDD
jgi:uncharacterized membrane protein YcaP (DUF421 family)